MIGWLTRKVRFEQAVYGTFPFWHRGYSILAKSPGCAPEWIARLREACPRYGEPPRDASEPGGAFALRLPDGHWMVVRAYSPGADDRGRPNAMAFHAAFLAPKDYRRLRCPLDLLPAFRTDWSAADIDQTLEPGRFAIPRAAKAPATPEAQAVARALRAGRKVWVQSEHGRGDLIRATWPLLTRRLRRRIEWATLAYGLGNHFDLLATPKRPASGLDPSYAEAAELKAVDVKEGERKRPAWLAIPIALAIVAIAAVAWSSRGPKSPAPLAGAGAPPGADSRPAPLPDDYPPDPELERERPRLFENFVQLADKFQVAADEGTTLSEGMRRFAEGVRYRGPWLSDKQLRALESEVDGAIPLAWHRHLLRFADDRPLPDGFDAGPLPWQLAAFAWSFHSDAARATATDDPFADLGHWLARPWLVDPHPLADRYPPLSAYAEFLQKLPRER